MRQLKVALRTLFKSPFVTAVAILSLALGIGANAAIFSLFDQLLLRPLPVRDPGELVDLHAPGPNPGSQSCCIRRRLPRCLLVSDVPRPREGASHTRGARRAPHAQREPLIRAATGERSGDARLGLLFPDARRLGGARTPDRPRRRPDHRRAVRDRAQLWLLAVALRRRSIRDRQADHGERESVHDHRRRTEWLRRHHAGRASARVPAHHHAPCGVALVHRVRQPAELLDLSLRPDEAGRHHRADGGGTQSRLPADHQGRRSAAARDDEPADAGEVQSEGDRRHARAARSEHGAQAGADANDAAVSRSRSSCCSSPARTSRTCCSRAVRTARWR